MFDKLDEVEARFERLTQELGDPTITSDSSRLQQVAKQQSDLEPLVATYREYKELKQQIEEARELLDGFPEIELAHVRREDNVDADALVNAALDAG